MKSDRNSLLQLHLAVILFGLAGVLGKMLAMPAAGIVLGRSALGAATLGLVLLARRRLEGPSLTTGERVWPWLAVSGAVLAFHWFAFFHSIEISSVAIALITFSSFPLFVTLLEPWVFRERRRAVDWMSAALVLAGLVLVVPDYTLANSVTVGAIWGTLSGLSFAILAMLNRRLVARMRPMALAAGQNLAAAIALLPVAWTAWLGPVIRGSAPWPDAGQMLLLAVLGILCTGGAHWLFIGSMQRLRAQLASIVTALEPVYGIGIACILLGDRPTLRTLAGGTLILSAVALANAVRTRARQTPANAQITA